MVHPFSLTVDPEFFYRSRSHGGVFDTLSAAITRRDPFMMVAGDLGVGKTLLCRMLLESRAPRTPASLLTNALLSPDDLLRCTLQGFGRISPDEMKDASLTTAPRAVLMERVERALTALERAGETALLIIDEAHNLPAETMEQLIEVARLSAGRHTVLQILFAGEPPVGAAPPFPASIDAHLSVRARLVPLDRDECEAYVQHRLTRTHIEP